MCKKPGQEDCLGESLLLSILEISEISRIYY